MKFNKLPSNWTEGKLESKLVSFFLESEEPLYASVTTINNGWGKAIFVVTNHRVIVLDKNNLEILEGTTWISNLETVDYSMGSLILKASEDKLRLYGLKDRDFSLSIKEYLLGRSKDIYENGNASEIVGLMPWSTREERVTQEDFEKSIVNQTAQDPNEQKAQNIGNIARLGILGAFLLGGDE